MAKNAKWLFGLFFILLIIFVGCSSSEKASETPSGNATGTMSGIQSSEPSSGQPGDASNGQSDAQILDAAQANLDQAVTGNSAVTESNSLTETNALTDAWETLGYEVAGDGDDHEGKPHILSAMKQDVLAGKLSEHDYHVRHVAMVYDPAYFMGLNGKRLWKEPVDLSVSLQWMLDHESQLSEQEKGMLKKAVLPADVIAQVSGDFAAAAGEAQTPCEEPRLSASKGQKMVGTVSAIWGAFAENFVTVVHAEENLHDKMIFEVPGFKYQAALLYLKDSVLQAKLDMLRSAVVLAGAKFEQVLGEYDEILVVYVNSNLPACVSAKSYFTQGVRVLELNPNAGAHELVGGLLEEVFYLFTGMAVDNGAASFEVEWLREATSAWGVHFAFPDLNYEHRYAPHLYNFIDTPYFALSDEKMKSWYQYFLYVTEVLGETSYVKDIYAYLSEHMGPPDMNKALQAGTDEAGFRTYMAKFFMCLCGADDTTGSLSDADGVPSYTLIAETSQTGEEIRKLKLSAWQIADMMPFDIHHVMLGVSTLDPKQGLNILNNMGSDVSNKAGMAIGIMKNDKMTWMMGPSNEMSHYSLDFEKHPADYVHILLFNADMKAVEVYKYALGAQKLTKGTGTMQVTYTEKWDNAKESGEKNIRWESEEKVEKLSIQGSDDLQGLLNAMTGETYLVQEMAVDYSFQASSAAKGSYREEKTSATGIFFHNSTPEAGTQLTPGGLLPGTAGLGQLNDALGQLKDLEGMEGLDGADFGLNAEEQAILENGADLGAMGLSPDEINAVNGLMRVMGSIPRIKFDPGVDSLMLFPGLPPEITGEPWVEGTTEVRTKDADGKIVTKSQDVKMTPPVLLPQWFVNPDAAGEEADLPEMEAMEGADALSAYQDYLPTDVEDIMDRLKGFSDTGNAVNVMGLNGKSVVTVEVGGFGEGGVILEVVRYVGTDLFARFTWTEQVDGVQYNLTVEMNYRFE